MKKILTIAAVALVGAIVLPSCKKDYTCTCTYNGVTSTSTINANKRDAKAACDLLELGGYDCSLD